ncbi:hypothetical protein MRB53_033340 [Persea americana]|uniref:Uncharacterized protein n=1 Tax=Persea americana TaxID=3435 RepID=A0ACC2KUJ2_PERAE|nr:hypothetical protein MRB53_033340 [Persea americana]
MPFPASVPIQFPFQVLLASFLQIPQRASGPSDLPTWHSISRTSVGRYLVAHNFRGSRLAFLFLFGKGTGHIQMGRVGSYVMRAPSREHLRDSRDVRRDGKGIAYRWTVWVA